MSIKAKVIVAAVILMLLAGVGVWWELTRLGEAALDVVASDAVTDAKLTFDNLEKQDVQKLSGILDVLMSRDDLRALYLTGDRDALYAAASPLAAELADKYGVTHVYFERPEPESTIFLRLHGKDRFDDRIERKTYKLAVESKSYGAGKELGKTAFALRVVHPYYGPTGDLVGYMEVGEEIDHFFDILKEQTGDEFAMVLLKDKLSAEDWATMRESAGQPNNWDDNESVVVANATSDEIGLGDLETGVEALDDRGSVFQSKSAGGVTTARGAFPVYDVAGVRVGAVIVAHDISSLTDELVATRANALLLLAAVGVVLVVALVLALNVLVFKRLSAMMDKIQDASLRLAGGDFSEVEFKASGNDEIGEFERFFGEFLKLLRSAFQQLSGK